MLTDTIKEAVVLSKYLGAKQVLPTLELRYVDAIEKLNLNLTDKEQKLLTRLINSPFLLPLIDGGLALIQPQNGIRKRLLAMSALMETETAYAHLFLTRENQSFALIRFLYRGGIAVFKGLIGVCLLKCLRWN
jgi:hypothetical protein